MGVVLTQKDWGMRSIIDERYKEDLGREFDTNTICPRFPEIRGLLYEKIAI